MALFRPNVSFLGIDIGTTFVKAAQLSPTRGGRFNLDTFGSVPLANSIIRANNEQSRNDVAAQLNRLLEAINASTKNVVAGIPGFATFSTLIELPLLSDDELAFALKTEATKYVPMPQDQIVLDWKVIDRGSGINSDSSKMRVLLIAILKEYVDKYVAIFEKANINLVAVELNAIASARSLVGTEDQATLIMDMGGNTTDLSVVYRGGLWFTKTVEVGGETFTKVISQSLNVDGERAEQFKRDADFDFSPEQLSSEQLPRVLRPLIDQIVGEMKRAMDLFQLTAKRAIGRIVLTGGSTSLRHFDRLMSSLIGISDVRLGEPWQFVERDPSVIDITDSLKPGFAVAAGLAMREGNT